MELFLLLLSGICWTIVYIEIIYEGLKDKTYGMPLFALALNITWEGLYTVRDLSSSPIPLQGWINLVWFCLDLMIVYIYMKYGKKEFSKHANEKYFIPWSLTVFGMAIIIQYSFLIEFGTSGASYSAFLQNLIMSVLFITMLNGRKSIKGQNQMIAVCKWIGTLAPTILIGVIRGDQFALVIGIFCSIFDLIYLYCLHAFAKVPQNCGVSSTVSQKTLGVFKAWFL